MRRRLLVLLLVAAALRLTGIAFGLDLAHVRRTVLGNLVDERGMVQSVHDGFLRGDMHPREFLNRGTGTFYLFGAFDAAVLAVRAPRAGGWTAQLVELELNPSLLHLLHRLASAAAGVLTVALLVRVCRRELGTRAALLAGAMLAVGYLHVRESHFGTVDVTWGLFTLLTVDQALLLVRDPGPRRYALTGLLVGATAAVKYFGAVMVAHLVVAHLVAVRRARLARREARGPPGAAPATATAPTTAPGARRLLLGLVCVAAGFVALTPVLLFAPGDFVRSFTESVQTWGADPGGGNLVAAILHHGYFSFAVGMGEPVFVLALAGLVVGWRRGGGARLLGVFALLKMSCLLLTEHHPVRFGVAPVVLLTPLAALAADALLALPPLRPRAAAAALVTLLLFPSALRSIAFDLRVAGPDTRVQMIAAIDALHVSPEDVVALGEIGLPKVRLGGVLPFVDLARRVLHKQGPTLAELRAHPPRFILRDLSPGAEQPLWEALAPLVQERYREKLALEPRPEPALVHLPDLATGTPAHMMPFAKPWGVTRPGSALVLYERIDP